MALYIEPSINVLVELGRPVCLLSAVKRGRISAPEVLEQSSESLNCYPKHMNKGIIESRDGRGSTPHASTIIAEQIPVILVLLQGLCRLYQRSILLPPSFYRMSYDLLATGGKKELLSSRSLQK